MSEVRNSAIARRITLAVGALFGLCAVPGVSAAHSGLVDPAPRNGSTFPGPCGQGDVIGPRTVLEPGASVMVQWDANVSHGGTFSLAFSPNDDAGFSDNALGSVTDEYDVQQYKMYVTLPMCTCDGCTLQLLQSPGYYSCADIELRSSGGEDVPPCPMAEVPEPSEGSSGSSGNTSGNTSGSGGGSGASPAGGVTFGPIDDDGQTGGASGDSARPGAGEGTVEGGCSIGSPQSPGLWLLLVLVGPALRRFSTRRCCASSTRANIPSIAAPLPSMRTTVFSAKR